jgi:hypothetical protein
MEPLDRRTLLTAAGALSLGSLAGCTDLFNRSPAAGSLRLENDHDLPHAIRLEVTGVGAEPGEGAGEVTGDVTVPPAQRTLTASTTVEPGESETYEGVFTEPVWYGVQFTLDGAVPDNDSGTTVFNPVGNAGDSWTLLGGQISGSGDFSWVISSTENPGQFDG